ncbi:MAG: sugar-binding protein, partial [Armatimonadota bacterium]
GEVTGSERVAAKFSYPLRDDPGPTHVVSVGKYVFFTSPSTGRIGVINSDNDSVDKTLTVGGYISDIVAATTPGLVYVADALGDRVVVIDARKREILREVEVPAQPWALAYYSTAVLQRSYLVAPTRIERVYVACREGRALVALDASSSEKVATADLPGMPRAVWPVPVLNSGWWGPQVDDRVKFALHPRVAVELWPAYLDADTLEPVKAPAREASARLARRTSVNVSVPSAGVEEAARERPAFVAPRLAVKVDGDLSEWERAQAVSLPVKERRAEAYPDWKGLADLTARWWLAWDNRNLYFAADVTDDRFHQPRGDELMWQADCIQVAFDLKRDGSYDREYGFALSPGGPAVWCWYGPEADASKISLKVRRDAGHVAYEAALPWNMLGVSQPREGLTTGFTMVVMDSDGGPREGGLEWTPGIMLGKDASAFGVMALAKTQSREAAARAREESQQTAVTTVSADNSLLLKIGDEWLDVTSVADPWRGQQRPLTARDEVGSITVSIDDGPEYDWTRRRWMDPDSQMFLVSDSEEYWRHNAPTFSVNEGQHVLKVRMRRPHVRLDALRVRRSPENWLDVSVSPLPREVHERVELPGYQGMFYYDEPVGFEVRLANGGRAPRLVRLRTTVFNYMGEALKPQTATVRLAPGQTVRKRLSVSAQDAGRFRMEVRALTDDGAMTKTVRFVRLPKLEHPRLLVRRDNLAEVMQRVEEHPRLFERYVQWLRRMTPRGGKWPDRFLPPGLTRQEMGAAAPDDMKDVRQREQRYGWRMYDAAWRMLGTEFAAMYIAPEHRAELMDHLRPLLRETQTSGYCQYHHHGPFFPGAVAALIDMAPEDSLRDLPLYEFCARRRGDLNVLPWTLLTVEEPITADDRALIWRLGMFENNLEQYFMTHVGRRGGRWWQNPWTGCHCPMHGILLTFVYMGNFFDEPRIFEKPFFRGFLTFHRYLDPIRDNRRLMPTRRGPLGEPWRWILTALTRHPLEKSLYRWDEWIAKMDGPLADETQAVDDLMALKGMPYIGPLQGGQHHFTTGVSVPVALALGWYDPAAPEVTWEELPPATLFDFDGWAVMRSGWTQDATEVYFNSGARDHTSRAAPNHFMVWRGGEALIGWPALWGDDGNNTPMWGNVVVAGDDWVERWRLNLTHPRNEEHVVVNRFSRPTWAYISRDRRLIGYAPAENGWGGGLDFHGHTQTIFLRDGRVIAYETHPRFDYVAGDASNAWPLDEMVESYRQLVYVRPDTVVVYDRVRLGTGAGRSGLVLATGPRVEVNDEGFTVRAGDASLRGLVLLPEQARLSLPQPIGSYQWKDQRLLRIEPGAAAGGTVEYLTVLRTGGKDVPDVRARASLGPEAVSVVLDGPGDTPVEVRFNRPGSPVGGQIAFGAGDRRTWHALVQEVDDSYRHWRGTPHYRAWTNEPRFEFVQPRPEEEQ